MDKETQLKIGMDLELQRISDELAAAKAAAWRRITDGGGTLAYVAEIKEALRAMPEQAEPVELGGVMSAEDSAEAFWGRYESNAAPPADGVVEVWAVATKTYQLLFATEADANEFQYVNGAGASTYVPPVRMPVLRMAAPKGGE